MDNLSPLSQFFGQAFPDMGANAWHNLDAIYGYYGTGACGAHRMNSEQSWIKPGQNILPLDGSTQCIDVYMPREPELASSAPTPVFVPLYEPPRVVEIPPYVPEEDEEEQKPAELYHCLRTSYHPRTPASSTSLPTPAPSPANGTVQVTSKKTKRVVRPVVVSSIVPPALLSPRARYRTKENPRSHRRLPTARPRISNNSQDSSIAGVRISRAVRAHTPNPASTPRPH